MGQLRIRIGDNYFRLSCEDTQEDRVRELARDIGLRIEDSRQEMPGASEARVMSMTMFGLCDELDEALRKLRFLEAELQVAKGRRDGMDQVKTIDQVSNRVASIIRRLDALPVRK